MAIPPPPEGPQQPHPQHVPAAGGQSHPPGTGQPYPGQPHQGRPYPGQPYVGQQPPAYGGWPGAQPYGYGPQQPPPINGAAIAALVLGILCFLPLVGLVLGLIALSQINKRGERGKGLAVAGIALSSVGAVLLSLWLVTGAAGDFMDGFRDGMRESRKNGSAFSLDKGECFNAPGGRMSGEAYDVDVVSCEEPHDGEVFGSFRLPDGGHPGEKRLTDMADARCSSLVGAYVGDPDTVGEDIYLYFYGPTSGSYARGDREVSCILGKENGKLTGSLRDAGRGGGSGGNDGDSGGSGGSGGLEDGPGGGAEV